jgi:hypothetical protein
VPWPKTDLAASVTRIPDLGAGAFAWWCLSAVVCKRKHTFFQGQNDANGLPVSIVQCHQ